MDLQTQIRDAMLAELKCQAADPPEDLQVSERDRRVEIRGSVDLDDLVMVAVSAVAGGP